MQPKEAEKPPVMPEPIEIRKLDKIETTMNVSNPDGS